MKKYIEKTVFDKSNEAMFYVVKFNGRYLGEDSLVDSLDDAKAFDDYDDADWALDDLVDSIDLDEALKDDAYDLQYFKDQEKKYWGEDYESEKKDSNGLIDDFDARAEVRKNCSVRGVFASKFTESK